MDIRCWTRNFVDHGGDVNVDLENAFDIHETQVNESTKLLPVEPLVELHLRRSTKERRFLQKYSPLLMGESLKYMKKLWRERKSVQSHARGDEILTWKPYFWIDEASSRQENTYGYMMTFAYGAISWQ